MAKKDKINKIFKALADPTRREIFHLLVVASTAMSLTQLANEVKLTRQGATKHIKVLEIAGMVNTNEVGRERYCLANLNALTEIRNWLAFYDKFWDDAMKKLDMFLTNKTKG